MRKKTMTAVLAAILSVSIAACGSASTENQGAAEKGENTSTAPTAKQENVELKFYNTNQIYSPEEFQKYFIEPAEKKFPNIKITFVPTNNKLDPELDSMVATGDIPDLIMGSVGRGVFYLSDRNLTRDLTPLIKKYNYDVNQLDPSYLHLAQEISNNQIFGLPIYAGGAPIYYNKDIFDKFGVSYPSGRMTWDDYNQLARKLARQDNGVPYYGFLFDPATVVHMNNLSLPLLDPTGKKPAFNTGDWKNYLQMLESFYQFPGYNLKRENVTTAGIQDLFNKDKTLAMLLTSQLLAPAKLEGVEHWDISPYPTSPNKPGIGTQPYAFFTYVSSTSKHPDEAFQVVAYWASDEYQLAMSKQAVFLPVSASLKVRDAFGSESSFYKGKNVSAFFAYKNADLAPAMFTKYHDVAKNALIKVLQTSVVDKKDVNTALREAEESVVKSIQQQESGK
jgi:multiple sugar transport system substrate-binding protein